MYRLVSFAEIDTLELRVDFSQEILDPRYSAFQTLDENSTGWKPK